MHIAGQDLGQHNAITGRSGLEQLSVDSLFSTVAATWPEGDAELLVKPVQGNNGREHFCVSDSLCAKQESEQSSGVLDAKHKPADSKELTSSISNLNDLEQK